MNNNIIKEDLVQIVLSENEVIEFGISRKEVQIIISAFLNKLRNSIINFKSGERIERVASELLE
jgi:hypothetical protein